jgi:hypothetical protein
MLLASGTAGMRGRYRWRWLRGCDDGVVAGSSRQVRVVCPILSLMQTAPLFLFPLLIAAA